MLFPMGWDAFGSPAEQFAIKNHVYPESMVKDCIKTFKSQLMKLGYSFDWSREFATTDPKYYKWTQWQFLQFYKHGLAYKAEKEINWCPKCLTGLSNEDAEGGVCERCGTKTEKKLKSQWMLKMSSYAQRLLDGLDKTEFLEKIKVAQINWIGRSEGAEVDFKIDGTEDKLTVFTTRPDTLYGVTFMVMSPEHKYLEKYESQIKNIEEVHKYQEYAKSKTDIERTDLTKEKTGVKLEGLEAINPVNNKKIEIWISDYVLSSYGTGAIMAVPAHDERDYEFATKFNIPIIEVKKSILLLLKLCKAESCNAIVIPFKKSSRSSKFNSILFKALAKFKRTSGVLNDLSKLSNTTGFNGSNYSSGRFSITLNC